MFFFSVLWMFDKITQGQHLVNNAALLLCIKSIWLLHIYTWSDGCSRKMKYTFLLWLIANMTKNRVTDTFWGKRKTKQKKKPDHIRRWQTLAFTQLEHWHLDWKQTPTQDILVDRDWKQLQLQTPAAYDRSLTRGTSGYKTQIKQYWQKVVSYCAHCTRTYGSEQSISVVWRALSLQLGGDSRWQRTNHGVRDVTKATEESG